VPGLDQKTIFITGGASGIGRAVAERFGRAGWFVGIADIDEEGMAGTAALISAGHSSQHVLDVRDRAAWDLALAAFAEASGGRIDVVFNNAGIPIGGRIVDCSTEEVERTLDINLKGVIFGAQAAYPWLKASAPGSCLLNTAQRGGDLWRARRLGLFGDQVRRALDHRIAGWRVAGRRHPGARSDAELHRNAVARSRAEPRLQPGYPGQE